MHNRKLYIKLLRQYAAEFETAPARIRELLAAGQRDEAYRIAHTVKGTAGNLGAKAVQALAGELESAISSGEKGASFDEKFAAFEDSNNKAVNSIKAAFGPFEVRDSGNAGDATRGRQTAETLLALFEEGNARAVDLIDAEKGNLTSFLTADVMQKISRAVAAFDFDSAAALCRQALNKV